jgi:hypothetical protein
MPNKEVMTPEVDRDVTLEELTKENETLKKERSIMLKQLKAGATAQQVAENANQTISLIMNALEMYKNFLSSLQRKDGE